LINGPLLIAAMVFCGTLGFIHRMSNLKRIIESAKSNPKTTQEEKYNEKLY
jgi:hypothetical protein